LFHATKKQAYKNNVFLTEMRWSHYNTQCSSSDVTGAVANQKEEQRHLLCVEGRWLGAEASSPHASEVPGLQHPENFCLYL